MFIDDLSTNSTTTLPSQRKGIDEKTPEWIASNIRSLENHFSNDDKMNKMYRDMAINYDLYDGIFYVSDLENVFNTFQLKGVSPSTLQNYPIETTKLNRLIGEEALRGFHWSLRVLDEDSVSQKQKDINDTVSKKILSLVTDPTIKNEEIPKEIDRFKRYIKYDYKDLREVAGIRLLEFLYKQPDNRLDILFNKGFKDAVIAGMAVNDIDILAGQPIIKKCNPLSLKIWRNDSSDNVDDSYAFMYDEMIPIGQVIDNWYDELTEEEIDYLEQYRTKEISSNSLLNYNLTTKSFPVTYDNLGNTRSNNIITVDNNNNVSDGTLFDEEGNVRVKKFRWCSERKVGFYTFYDDEGNEQKVTVDENFKYDKTKGGEIKWKWINEWWQATKVADKIMLGYGPRKVQFRQFGNLSKCKPGYVGTIFPYSMMQRVKPFKYLYDIFMYRLLLAFSKYKTPILELDLSKKPDGWDTDKWFYYLEQGYMLVDPFREIKKGAATGKLAGSMNTTGRVFNMDMGNYIQQHINVLQYIELKIGDIISVSKQREGDVGNRETLGGIKEAITQSTYSTEEFYFLYDDMKCRTMMALLDTAKVAWSDKTSKRLQYIDDGLNDVIYDLDIRDITESEYGLFLSNETSSEEIKRTLVQLAQAGIQNDKMDFSMLMSILKNKSIAAITKDIESMEAEHNERVSESQKQQLENQRQMKQDALDAQQHSEDREDIRTNKQYVHEMQMKEIDISLEEAKTLNTKEISDNKIELEKARLKVQDTIRQLQKEEETYNMDNKKEITQMELKSKEKIAALKNKNKKK